MHSRTGRGRAACPPDPRPGTSWRVCVELLQRSVAPKQKQRVQPLGLAASSEKVPRRHWSHLGPCTFSWVRRAGPVSRRMQGDWPALPGFREAPTGCGRGRTRRPGPPGTPAPHLAVALARAGVAHAGRGAGLVAVAGAAAGVAVEAGGTGVAAAPGHVGSAPVGVQDRLGLPPGPLAWGESVRGPLPPRTEGAVAGCGRPRAPPARSRAARSCPSLALAAVLVTGGVCELLDAGPRAAALLTAGQRVAAEGPGLAGGALGWHGARRADALARELVAQAAAAVAGCGEQRRAGGPSALLAGPRPQPWGARPGARRPQQLLRLGASLPESSHPWNLLGNQARPWPQAARGPTDGEAGLIC